MTTHSPFHLNVLCVTFTLKSLIAFFSVRLAYYPDRSFGCSYTPSFSLSLPRDVLQLPLACTAKKKKQSRHSHICGWQYIVVVCFLFYLFVRSTYTLLRQFALYIV